MICKIEFLRKLFNFQPAPSDFDGEVPNDLVFDDECIDDVLYGSSSQPPTLASIFKSARKLLDMLNSDSTDPKSEEALLICLRFMDDGHAVSPELFLLLSRITTSLLPVWPKPLSSDMPSSVGPLMECLWGYAHKREDDELKIYTGRLWEWYEYVGRYADARRVLSALEDIHRRRDEQTALSRVINNLAFQFQKEHMWEEAFVHFLRAARLAKELGMTPDYANAMANYWGCRFELDGAVNCKTMATELHRLGDILHEAGWKAGERKVLVLLARLEAAMGNPHASIPMLEKAVAIDESQNSMYLEHDRKLLEDLNKQYSDKRAHY